MPELPEVEVVRSFLEKKLLRRKIKEVVIFLPKFLKNTEPQIFQKKLIGEKAVSIKRHGKNLLIFFGKYVVVNHLRMAGNWFVITKNDIEKKENLVTKNTNNVVLKFCFVDEKNELFFSDNRHFATFHIYNKGVFSVKTQLKNVGYDLLKDNIDPNLVYHSWKTKKQPIKSSLLEQKVISGIGNLYADEILFRLKISPFLRTNELSLDKVKELLIIAKKIFKKAILEKGTTVFDFQVNGKIGNYQKFLNVYRRFKKNCFSCKKSKISRAKIGQRSSYFCWFCQNIPFF